MGLQRPGGEIVEGRGKSCGLQPTRLPLSLPISNSVARVYLPTGYRVLNHERLNHMVGKGVM